MSYGKLQANLSGQSSESCNLATFTLSITSTVRRPNFQTPVLSPGATIWANVSDMVNLESVEHPQQHFMKINFLAFIVILAYIWLSYNTVRRRPAQWQSRSRHSQLTATLCVGFSQPPHERVHSRRMVREELCNLWQNKRGYFLEESERR